MKGERRDMRAQNGRALSPWGRRLGDGGGGAGFERMSLLSTFQNWGSRESGLS